MQLLDDPHLLAALLGPGREAALAECIRRFGPMIKRTAWRITGDEHRADDVSQAVFLVLLRQAAKLRDMKFLAGWLYRVAVLTARDVIKSETRRHRRELEAVMVARARATSAALPEGLDEAVDGLPEIYRQVIVAHYFEGRNYSELAARLGISEATAKQRGHRAIDRLRKRLGTTIPGLTVAALAAMLAAEAARAATTSMTTVQIAAIQAAVLQGASPQLVGLADAVAKAMFWAKAKLAAFCAAGAAGVTGVVIIASLMLPAAPGPVAHYKFAENQGVTAADVSASANHGTLKGRASWTVGPKPGMGALRLDGKGAFVATPQDLNKWLGNTATVAFWIRTRQLGDPQFHLSPAVMGIETPTGDENDVSWGRINEKGQIGISVGRVQGENNLWSTKPVNDGVWHHVTLTRDASTGAVQLFLAGLLDGEAQLKPGIKTTPIDVIGELEVQELRRKFYLQCDLADLRIYDRLLSAAEIRRLAD